MIQPGYYQSINTRIPLIDRSENIMYHGIVKILLHDRNMGIFRKGIGYFFKTITTITVLSEKF